MSRSGRWGDACLACGHPADYHGVTFCAVVAGGSVKRPCDCPGYKNPAGEDPKPGMCGEMSPFLLPNANHCSLTAGHTGWHENDGAAWSPQPELTDLTLGRIAEVLATDKQAVLKVAAAQQILIDAGLFGGGNQP